MPKQKDFRKRLGFDDRREHQRIPRRTLTRAFNENRAETNLEMNRAPSLNKSVNNACQKTTLLRPAFFALYRRSSASLMTFFGVSVFSMDAATPILTVTEVVADFFALDFALFLLGFRFGRLASRIVNGRSARRVRKPSITSETSSTVFPAKSRVNSSPHIEMLDPHFDSTEFCTHHAKRLVSCIMSIGIIESLKVVYIHHRQGVRSSNVS